MKRSILLLSIMIFLSETVLASQFKVIVSNYESFPVNLKYNEFTQSFESDDKSIALSLNQVRQKAKENKLGTIARVISGVIGVAVGIVSTPMLWGPLNGYSDTKWWLDLARNGDTGNQAEMLKNLHGNLSLSWEMNEAEYKSYFSNEGVKYINKIINNSKIIDEIVLDSIPWINHVERVEKKQTRVAGLFHLNGTVMGAYVNINNYHTLSGSGSIRAFRSLTINVENISNFSGTIQAPEGRSVIHTTTPISEFKFKVDSLRNLIQPKSLELSAIQILF